jgi:hypothetical protein
MNRPTKQSPGGRAYLDLQNRTRREQRPTQELLTLHVLERWLARLMASSYAGSSCSKLEGASARMEAACRLSSAKSFPTSSPSPTRPPPGCRHVLCGITPRNSGGDCHETK